MERIIKTVYTTFYQKIADVSYKEQAIVTLATIGFLLAIIIPLLTMIMSDV